MSTAAQIEITSETELIEAWRFEALERAGYRPQHAAELAARNDVDLHAAVDLIRRGCSSDLALQILL